MLKDQPAVLYLPMDDLDVTAGHALLRNAGIDIVDVGVLDDESMARRVVAVMVGYTPVTEDLLGRLPGLRLIAAHSAGYDMVDMDAAVRHHVQVCNVPDAASEEVATHAFALALALLRHLPDMDRAVRSGHWTHRDRHPVPRRLSTLRCGVVGMGRIGIRFARLAQAVFGSVVGCDPWLPERSWPSGIPRCELDELLRCCHCVSLHVPLTGETRHLIGARELELMPPDAILVNTSRGALVDEIALAESLRTRTIAGAGLDVLAVEPPAPDSPILQQPQVLLSPHSGYQSMESLRDYAEVPARNVIALLRDGRPITPVSASPGT